MSKIASFGQLILNYHNWQVCTSQIVRVAYLGQVQSSLVREEEDCQNWQIRTSQIARIGNSLDKCSLLSLERKKITRIGNFGQVRLPELATLDKSVCQNWQL